VRSPGLRPRLNNAVRTRATTSDPRDDTRTTPQTVLKDWAAEGLVAPPATLPPPTYRWGG